VRCDLDDRDVLVADLVDLVGELDSDESAADDDDA
jgi:hypothetical protein